LTLLGHKWEEKDILITVKTYSDASKANSEAGYIAGVSDGRWIRLYPLRYPHLPYRIMFRKYDIIRVNVVKNTSDSRPESFHPDSDSIVRISHLGTGNHWEKRREYLLPTANESMCEIIKLQKSAGKSIGMFKPRQVKDLIITREKDEWAKEERKVQLSFERKTNPIENIPYSFTYFYKCEDKRCKGHKMKCYDWELARLYRKLKVEHSGNSQLIEEHIRARFLDQMFGPQKDSYFFVGNRISYPQRFVILGVFCPPIP
jgi:hypothetical protein